MSLLSTTLMIELALLGAVIGFLAGLLGIGGGMMMVPFITFILTARGVGADLAVKVAIATSMATIMFTALSSVRAHHQHGAVRWGIVWRLSPGIVVGSFAGSLGLFTWLKGSALSVLFAVFVSLSATQMLLAKKPAPTRQLPGTLGLSAAGGVIGFLSGLVGAGGAFISVPFMTWCNVAVHQAVATSAALGFPIALANSIGFVWSGQAITGLPEGAWGYVWLPGLMVIALASVLMAPLGARAAHALPVGKLKRIFAGVLYLLALTMLYKGCTP